MPFTAARDANSIETFSVPSVTLLALTSSSISETMASITGSVGSGSVVSSTGGSDSSVSSALVASSVGSTVSTISGGPVSSVGVSIGFVSGSTGDVVSGNSPVGCLGSVEVSSKSASVARAAGNIPQTINSTNRSVRIR